MKNNIKYIAGILLGGVIGFSACTDSFESFNTCHVTDEQMEQIVYETEMETRDQLRLGEGESIDFNNDHHSEIWWEEMEKAVVRHGVPYYEDE